MVAAQAIRDKIFTIEEYFALEDKTEQKYEYHNGKLHTMAGGSIAHNQIQTNLITSLNKLIDEKNLEYFVFGSDLKIHIPKNAKFVYPDVIVICERPKKYKDRSDTIVNPVLIFEILSDSTGKFDKEDKFDWYRSIESFREYVLIDQNKPFVQSYFKAEADLWRISSARNLDRNIPLFMLDFELSLSEIYNKVPELTGESWSDS